MPATTTDERPDMAGTTNELRTLNDIRHAEKTVQRKEKLYLTARENAKLAKEAYESAIADLRGAVREIDEPSLPLGARPEVEDGTEEPDGE